MRAVDRYDSLLIYYAELADLDWTLLKRQIQAESNFDPLAISSAGAQGLAQFMPATWKEWVQKAKLEPGASPFNPEDAICVQSVYMAWLVKLFMGDVRLALAAYNAGPGTIAKLASTPSRWPKETIAYVDRILGPRKPG